MTALKRKSPPHILLEYEPRRGECLDIREDDRHHLFSVRRMKRGSRVIGILPDGGIATLDVVSRNGTLELEVIHVDQEEPDTTDRTLTVVLPLIKRMVHLDFIIEKGTELGVTAWTGTVTANCADRGLSKAFTNRIPRWKRIIKSAVEQSGRRAVPEISGMLSWSETLRASREFEHRVVADFSAGYLTNVVRAPWKGDCIFMCGPEGGWTDTERQDLDKAGFKRLWFGPIVLRSETALLAGISLILLSNVINDAVYRDNAGDEC